MKRLLTAGLLLIALLLPAMARASASNATEKTDKTDKIKAAMLSKTEIPPECKVIDGSYPVDIQVQILSEHYDAYQKLLPPLQGRQAQSLQCGNEIGTLYYFEFADAASRERAENFIRSLLWGGGQPSAGHPELIEHGDSLLCVISFQTAPDALLAALRAKLSGGAVPANKKPSAGTANNLALTLIGDWHGMSLCLVKPSGCHDEESLYHIKPLDQPGRFSMQGDKIVDGKPVTMGTVDCSFDVPKSLLHCEGDHGTFDLTLQGDRLEGSMSLPDNQRWREIKLVKMKQ